MSGPGVGFEYPPIEVAWLKRDLLLFANSIGVTVDELHFLYVRPAELPLADSPPSCPVYLPVRACRQCPASQP